MITCLVLVFIVLLLLGAPIAYCMGAGAYLSMAMYMPQAKVQVIAKMFGGLDSFSLMAVPFFILAGNLKLVWIWLKKLTQDFLKDVMRKVLKTLPLHLKPLENVLS